MQNTIDQLRDIDPIDSISYFPLGIGWWVIIFIFSIITIAFLYFRSRKKKMVNSWEYYTITLLEGIQNDLNEKNTQDKLIELSSLIRRIAMQKFSRTECASLIGIDWLKWLEKNDTSNFCWTKFPILIENIYFHKKKPQLKDISTLIKASKYLISIQ